MEILSLIIADKVKSCPFKFHWRAHQLRITNLCFADDVMIFCNGDVESVRTIYSCLDKFSSLSGLLINRRKSVCYLSNVATDKASTILSILQFERGSTPAKFLGVPLISSKLTSLDCKPLIDRIIARVTSWTSKFLSFAGRLTLIRSVLFSIQAYWSAFFIFPSAVSKAIRAILSRFLWKGTSLQKFGAKVSWNRIALPCSEGGLGIKHIEDWNHSSIMMHLWSVINPNGNSLWAKWIRDTVIKDSNFWVLNIPHDCSWIWRKVLKLRVIALSHVHYIIGDGKSTSLWFDPWLNDSPLAVSNKDDIILNSGLPANATVADIIVNGCWSLPRSNYHKVLEFRQSFNPQTYFNSDCNDQVFWDSFSEVKCSIIWNAIRRRSSEVPWWKLVWNNLSVPRFSFFLWLAFHNGFKTKVTLASYGLDIDKQCLLCSMNDENFQHLFFECPFSFQIFFPIMRLFGWPGSSSSWDAILGFLLNTRGQPFRKSILCLALAAIVYAIWKERNARLHGSNLQTPAAIRRYLFHIIKCRLHSYNRFRNSMLRPMFSCFSLP